MLTAALFVTAERWKQPKCGYESDAAQLCPTLCDPMDCSLPVYRGQIPLSMEFPGQEYWGGLPFLSPADLPNPGIEPRSPTLQALLTIWATREPTHKMWCIHTREYCYCYCCLIAQLCLALLWLHGQLLCPWDKNKSENFPNVYYFHFILIAC